ncbi:hypothetical protein JD844_006596 [Phrynosoma platyrhinos]|uniref:Cilia- and flagella-associated protein 46 n=1 Tax=Phrynosoma platyrhinos TaxID=52577 RepID=A0ABQ7T1N6_PHRPL|nr:hypothetical protein JD844_006596 [Phrynosoma platyrhinos]
MDGHVEPTAVVTPAKDKKKKKKPLSMVYTPLPDSGVDVAQLTPTSQDALLPPSVMPPVLLVVTPPISSLVSHKLVDISQIEDELESSPSLNIIYKIQTIKLQLNKNEIPQEATTDLSKIYEFLKASRKKLNHNERISLLLELGQLSLRLNYIPIACSCINDLKKCKISDQGKEIELDCLECDCEVKKLGPKIETYAKSVVEAQLKVIQKLELILNRAIRLRDPNVIQAVCATQWNICLPLLQPNLQHYVRKPLLAIAEILEKIDSMLILLRCQVHMEIARIEEKGDRIEAAMEHLQKAIELDNNGQYNEYLKMAFHRLNLNTMLYKSLERLEDQASLMVEQAKKGTAKDSVRKKRSLLMNAGRALAPEAFQIVLDSENETKVASSKSKGQISYLCAKAEHHSRSVEKADGHLKRIGRENEKERIKLWSEIAKTARKQGVWDVCRAACRFCLLYDDCQMTRASKRRKLFKKKSMSTLDEDQEGNVQRESPSPTRVFSLERDLLRTLAEVRFINAEATIHLLRTEGVQLNDQPVLPVDTSLHSAGHAPPQTGHEAEWNTYSLKNSPDPDFEYPEVGARGATSLRHGSILLASSASARFVPLGASYDAVERSKSQAKLASAVAATIDAFCNKVEMGKSLQKLTDVTWINNLSKYAMENFLRAAKIGEDLNEAWIVHNTVVYVLNHNKHLIASKRQREIVEPLQTLFSAIRNTGHCGNTTIFVTLCNALARALILPWIPKPIPKSDEKKVTEEGPTKRKKVCEFAMHLPNGSVPDEPVPVAMRQQVIATWVKAKQLVQHQIGRLHGSEDEGSDEGSSPMIKVFIGLEMYSCNGLGLMDFSLPSLSNLVKMTLECNWTDSLVQLQTITRLAHFAYTIHDHDLAMTCSQKALELGDKAMNNIEAKRKGMYAGEAGDIDLAMIAARHFWNACLPFIGSSADRQQLKMPTEVILKSIIKASEAKNKQETENMLHLHQWSTIDFQSSSLSDGNFFPGSDEDLTLRTFLYVLLFQVYADKNDWEGGLKVLDEAIQSLPRTKHRLPIFKHMVMVKARLGRNYIMEIQKFRDESEDYLSHMWHRLASVSPDVVGQLTCYQNAIEVLQKKEFELKKVDNMLGFAEWLYCNQFPLSEAIKHLDWAINILLYLKPIRKSPEDEDTRDQIMIRDLRHIKQLEALVRAHTIMAVISGHGSPSHEQHCLMAYAFVMRMWQPAAGKGSPTTPPKKDKSSKETKQTSPTTPPKKDKTSKETKQVQSVVKEKSRRKSPIEALPASVEEWASYECPEEVREAFRQDSNGCAVNRETILAPTRTLYYLDLLVKELQTILCTHLTLPVLHLAEIIARDVAESRSLADLYHLRFRQEIAFKKENALKDHQKETKLFDSTKQCDRDQIKKRLTAKDKEMNDLCTVSRCLYLLAVLANLEKNHGQAKALLEKAQLIGGNEMFWYNSTLCLTDAIVGDVREGKEKMMEFAKDLISGSRHATELATMCLEPYDKLIHIEKDFLSYGYKDYSAEALMARANIHRMLGKHTTYTVDKQSHYLDAYRIAQETVAQMEELFQHVNNMLPVNETRNINTPLMRKLANMKLILIEIILDIFVLINIEKKKKEARAEQIEQIIEDFVRFTPDPASVEQAWITLGHTIGHNAQAQLTSLQSLYIGCPDIKAKYLYLMGRSLHLLADQSNPLPSDILWCESTVRRQMWTQKYLFQSTEVLLQCINIALNNNMLDTAAAASLEMVECFGRFDPVSASQFLALYQLFSINEDEKNPAISNTEYPQFTIGSNAAFATRYRAKRRYNKQSSEKCGAEASSYLKVLEKVKPANPKEQREQKEKSGHQKEKGSQQKEKGGHHKEKSGQQKGKAIQPI